VIWNYPNGTLFGPLISQQEAVPEAESTRVSFGPLPHVDYRALLPDPLDTPPVRCRLRTNGIVFYRHCLCLVSVNVSFLGHIYVCVLNMFHIIIMSYVLLYCKYNTSYTVQRLVFSFV